MLSFEKNPKIDKPIVSEIYKEKNKEHLLFFAPNIMARKYPLLTSLSAGLWQRYTFISRAKC